MIFRSTFMPICRLLTMIVLFAGGLGWLPSAMAHAGVGHLAGTRVLHWNVDPWVMGSVLIAAGMYFAGVWRLWQRAGLGAGLSRANLACFCAGLLMLLLALVSPVDTLGDQLFSMHMVQHELLMLVAAPLLVAGRPFGAFVWAFPAGWRRRVGGLSKTRVLQGVWLALSRPFGAWSLHAAVLWAWHFPSLFQASLVDETVHTVQHMSFLISALLFWSSLIGAHSRLRHGAAVLYILSTAIHTGILGALLTFSPHVWYPAYAGKTAVWGLTLLEDQQLGGLIMWVPAGMIFVIAGLVFAARAISPAVAASSSSHRQAMPDSGR